MLFSKSALENVNQRARQVSLPGEEQSQTVAALNRVLIRDGYELAQESELSGRPIFAFRSLVRGVGGRPKNLIFASQGPKPEIGFADAIKNDIVILSGEESRLGYDRPISSSGLLCSDLVPGGASHTRSQCSKSRAACKILGMRRRAQAIRHVFQDLSTSSCRGAAGPPAAGLSSL